MKDNKVQIVGVYGFPYCEQLASLADLGKIDLLFAMPAGAPDKAKAMIASMIERTDEHQILVVNPSCAHKVADKLRCLPGHITLVKDRNPFTDEGIKLSA